MAQQAKEWLNRDQWRHLADELARRPARPTTVLLFGADLGVVALSWWLRLRGGVAGTVGAWVLMTFAFVQLYLILHEAAHSSVSGTKWLNNLVGHVSGWIFLLPFLTRQRNHLMHHVWTAHPTEDPENKKMISRFAVMTDEEARKLEFIWRYWLPVLTLNHFIGTWRDPFASDDLAAPSRRKARERRFAKVYGLGYLLLAVALVATGKLGVFLTWFLPPWIVFLAGVELLNLPHHAEAPLLDPQAGAPPYWAQAEVSHNCGTLPVWSGFVILNFNLHIAHHAFPKVPWYDLGLANRRAEALSAGASGEFQNEFRWALTNRKRPLLQVMGHFFDKRVRSAPASEPSAHVGAAG